MATPILLNIFLDDATIVSLPTSSPQVAARNLLEKKTKLSIEKTQFRNCKYIQQLCKEDRINNYYSQGRSDGPTNHCEFWNLDILKATFCLFLNEFN